MTESDIYVPTVDELLTFIYSIEEAKEHRKSGMVVMKCLEQCIRNEADKEVKYFRSRSDALRYFASTVDYSRLIMQVYGGKWWKHRVLLEREDGHLFTSSRRGFPDIKIHHLKKYKIEPYKKG